MSDLGALLLANGRYWSSVAPSVRAQLSRWERQAGAIPDRRLQTLALRKLREERFNVQAAATAATSAPRAHRHEATEAIVALQVMYDYLDLLTEQPLPDPLRDGRRLFTALTDAFDPEGEPRGGYLGELVRAVRLALARLPAADAIAAVALRGAERCAEAQVLSHAAAREGTAELERWAQREAAGTTLGWPEFRAGASASVLSLHALIALASRAGATPADAEAIDAVYLSIGALSMLDSLVDREEDLRTGALGYVQHYESREQMAVRLASLARDAAARARQLPDGEHHLLILHGVVAYYLSAPQAGSAFARPVTARLRAELAPSIEPTLALMRGWRLAKRARARTGQLRGRRRVAVL